MVGDNMNKDQTEAICTAIIFAALIPSPLTVEDKLAQAKMMAKKIMSGFAHLGPGTYP
jgi:hypothetical protein